MPFTTPRDVHLPATRKGPARPGSWVLALLALVLQLGCQAAPPPPSTPPPRVEAAPPATEEARQAPANPAAAVIERYDLERDEARGGHTIARHVGRTDEQLRERLKREQRISAASTYTDRTTAERVVGRTLAREKARLQTWLARQGPRPNLALDYRGDRNEPVGRSLTRRNPQPVVCSDAVVVLRWDGSRGFIVLTSYPEVSR